MDLKPVTVEEVMLIIKSLKSTGVMGHDGISCILLKIVHSVAVFVTAIINQSFIQSKYPTSFKYGVIIPVPKSGDPTEAKYQRSVTILSWLDVNMYCIALLLGVE